MESSWGQATVDLPDPLENPNPAEAQSADDLLSQLAGNEIDRLLAEADEAPATTASVAMQRTNLRRPWCRPGWKTWMLVLASAAADRDAAERTALHEPVHAEDEPRLVIDHSPKIELGEPAPLPLIFSPTGMDQCPAGPVAGSTAGIDGEDRVNDTDQRLGCAGVCDV